MRVVAGAAAIVEGEPGIFPAPVAGGLVRLNRWVRRHLGAQDSPTDPAETKTASGTPDDPPDPSPV